jgi:hypothetical protein
MELKDFVEFITQKCHGAQPLFITIRGSHAYGLNIETSDTDYCGVYYQPLSDLLSDNYVEQISDEKNDMVFYELGRFLELLENNNPSILEMLNTTDDCIVYKHPVMNQILEQKNKYLTKICKDSFGGYVVQQIKKAKGKDKKNNWEKDRFTRKYPMDFCYFHDELNSIPLKSWLDTNGFNQKFCGLTKLPHSKDLYALYYDYKSDELYNSDKYSDSVMWVNIQSDKISNFISGKSFKVSQVCGFKGIAFEDSNSLRLSAIPKDTPLHYFRGHITYNKDEYSRHCLEYRQYQEWLSKKNDARWVEVNGHGQKIDGKNMMHCVRLLRTSREIAMGLGLNIRRTEDREELLDIRRGNVDLESIILESEKTLLEISELYKQANLPDSVDKQWNKDLLLKIRKDLYAVR